MDIRQHLLGIYTALFKAFGPRHWWPADSRDEVIIGAVLAQNVAWTNVEQAICNLRAHHLAALSALHDASHETIAPLIRPTRYYNQKAKRLKTFTGFLFSHRKGNLDRLLGGPALQVREDLLRLNGFGEETVDSILLYAGNHPIFVIDAYTRRICERMGLAYHGLSYKGLQTFFMKNLPEDTALFNDFHAQLVYLGSTCCRKNNPACTDCPVRRFCRQRIQP